MSRYSSRTYLTYGTIPYGNHILNISMDNDECLYNYVYKNHRTLSKMPKDKIIRTLKSNVGSDWARSDMRNVNGKNVRAKDLKKRLRNYNF